MIALLQRLWAMVLAWFRPVRRVARLDPGDDDARFDGREVIDTSGKPLKAGHLRRALRDPRLLPKTQSAKTTLLGERKKVMSHADATRLFAGTQRTRNRNLRDLLTDPEQLARYGLPEWKTEADVAAALGIPERVLRGFTVHRERERVPNYIQFAVAKRAGGERVILAPKRRLKALQRRLVELLVDKLPVSDSAHGFLRGRSIRTNAAPHVAQPLVLKLDLRDFFPSVTFGRVRGLLIAFGYAYPVATCLAVLMTEAERQPVELDGVVYHVPIGHRYCVQGAPTSPGLCNAIVRRLDHRLEGLAKKFGAQYTRYADDLTFSGELDRDIAKRLRGHAERVINAEGFAVRADKTRVMVSAGRQRVAGVTVNRELGLSRQERRRLRAAIHHVSRDRAAGQDVKARVDQLRGKLAYVHMLNPSHATSLASRLTSIAHDLE